MFKKMSIYEDSNTDRFIKVEIKLEQNLEAFFSEKHKILFILDPDDKDYKGSEYANTLELKELKTQKSTKYGVVQQVTREHLEVLNSIFEYFNIL